MTTEQTHAAQTEPTAGGVRVPEGWQLVPVNPTDVMVEAGWIDKEDVTPFEIYVAMLAAAPSRDCLATTPADSGGEAVDCETCQDNGEVVTDWSRYLHSHEGDKGDEAVAECPDCDGTGKVAHPCASDANEIERLPADVISLVIAARNVAFDEAPSREALKELDKASEAFASRVPWEEC